jgi:hypothetical protein
MASENLPERPQAGPDTMTKIIRLFTRDSERANRVVEPSSITECKFNGKGLQMQEASTINYFYMMICGLGGISVLACLPSEAVWPE